MVKSAADLLGKSPRRDDRPRDQKQGHRESSHDRSDDSHRQNSKGKTPMDGRSRAKSSSRSRGTGGGDRLPSPSPHVPNQTGHGDIFVSTAGPTGQAHDVISLTPCSFEQDDTLSQPTHPVPSASNAGVGPTQGTPLDSLGPVTPDYTVTHDRPPQPLIADFSAFAAPTSARLAQSLPDP